jgi:CMP-2-keto-3-deoxyoctulosonic acid synthetase
VDVIGRGGGTQSLWQQTRKWGSKAEVLLADLENLLDSSEAPLPEGVKLIVESSKKKIVFSPTTIPWRKVGQIYFTLIDKIARYYHSDSAYPIYEALVCDLLKSVADYLEGVAALRQKPVLNKRLKIKISQLTQAKDLALPLGQNKIMELVNKYQVGSIAKWSHTLNKNLQNK